MALGFSQTLSMEGKLMNVLEQGLSFFVIVSRGFLIILRWNVGTVLTWPSVIQVFHSLFQNEFGEIVSYLWFMFTCHCILFINSEIRWFLNLALFYMWNYSSYGSKWTLSPTILTFIKKKLIIEEGINLHPVLLQVLNLLFANEQLFHHWVFWS